MGTAKYIGRVGGLAVALGVGIAVATTPGVAWADDTVSTSSGGTNGTAGATGTNGTSESEGTSTSTGTTTDPTGTSTAAGTEREGASRPELGAVDTTTSGTSASTDASVRQAPPGMVNATGGAQSSKKSSSDTSAKGDEAAEVSTEDSTLPKLVADSTATNPEAPAAAKAPVGGPRGGSDNNQRPVDKPTGAPRVEANTVTATAGAAPSRPPVIERAGAVVDAAVDQPAAQPPGTALPAPISPVSPAEVIATEVISAAPEEPTPPGPTVSKVVLGGLALAGLDPLGTDSPRAPVDSPMGWALAAWWPAPVRAGGDRAGAQHGLQPHADQPKRGHHRRWADVCRHADDRRRHHDVDDDLCAGECGATADPTIGPRPPWGYHGTHGEHHRSRQRRDRVGHGDPHAPPPPTITGWPGCSSCWTAPTWAPRTPRSPYSVSWNTTTVTNGNHTLTAVARDAAGNTTTSAPVTVTVANTAQIPVSITAITVDSYPSAVAISGNNAYVYGGDVISTINTITKTVTDQTALYNDPPAITPDGRKYVPNPNLYYQGNAPYDSVDVINTATNKVIKNIPIPICYDCAYANPSGPRDVVMSPDRNRVYVSEDYYVETGINTTVVTMIDTATDSVRGYVPTSPLSDMEIAPNGTIYAASAEYPVVTVYNADMSQIGAFSLTSLGYYFWSPTTALALNGNGTRGYVVVQDFGVGQHVSVIDTGPASPHSQH